MSSPVHIYFDLEETKSLLDIKTNTKDPDLELAGVKADAIVNSAMQPFAAAIPLAGDELTHDIIYAANAKAAAIYAGIIRNYELAKFWNDEYAQAIARITLAFTNLPTDVANPGIVYASSYRSEPLASRED